MINNNKSVHKDYEEVSRDNLNNDTEYFIKKEGKYESVGKFMNQTSSLINPDYQIYEINLLFMHDNKEVTFNNKIEIPTFYKKKQLGGKRRTRRRRQRSNKKRTNKRKKTKTKMKKRKTSKRKTNKRRRKR